MNRAEFLRLEAEIAEDVRRELLQAYGVMLDLVDVAALTSLIQAGQLAAIAAVLTLTEAQYATVVEAIERGFARAGRAEMQTVARAAQRAGFRSVYAFDHRAPQAAGWVTDFAREQVTLTRRTDQEVIRQVIAQGTADGRNPRDVARQLVGVRTPQGRVGSAVGLSDQMLQWVTDARTELEGDLPNYFTRRRRDKRFDKTVRRGNLTKTEVDKIATAYAERLRTLRAETIARTTATAALNAGRTISLEQAIADGRLTRDAVERVWDSAGPDGRTRDSHLRMDGQRRSVSDPFVSPGGARLRWPGDTGLGAPAEEVVACRCYVRTEVDFLAGVE